MSAYIVPFSLSIVNKSSLCIHCFSVPQCADSGGAESFIFIVARIYFLAGWSLQQRHVEGLSLDLLTYVCIIRSSEILDVFFKTQSRLSETETFFIGISASIASGENASLLRNACCRIYNAYILHKLFDVERK